MLANALDAAFEFGELRRALLIQHASFGQPRIELGLLGKQPSLPMIALLHRLVGFAQLGLRQGQFSDLIGGTDRLGLLDRLAGQAQLLIGRRVAGASRQKASQQ